MRKSLLKTIAATAIVGASALIFNVASVFAWTVPNDMAVIDETKSISIEAEIGTWSGDETLSTNKLLSGYKASSNTGNKIIVDGKEYGKSVQLKGISARAVAIKVSGKCQIDAYSNSKTGRAIEMSYSNTGDSSSATVLTTSTKAVAATGDDSAYDIATATYTGSTPTYIFIYATSDKYLSLINVTFVEDIPATNIDIEEESIDILVGEEYSLGVTLTPANANSDTSWNTDDSNVATVAGGVITGIGEGSTTITATNNGHTDTVTVNVAKQNGIEDLSPITAGTYTFANEGTKTIAKGKLIFDGKILAVDKAAYAAGTTYAVGDTENKIGGFFLKKGGDGGTFAVLLPNNTKMSTVVFVNSNSAIDSYLSEAYNASLGNLDKASATEYNVLTYTNNTGADKVVYITASNNAYIGQIVVESLSNTKYTGTNGIVAVAENGDVYAIGKITGIDDISEYENKTVTLALSDTAKKAGEEVIYKSVVLDGTSLTGEAQDGVYYLAIKVNNLTNDTDAQTLADKIKLTVDE